MPRGPSVYKKKMDRISRKVIKIVLGKKAQDMVAAIKKAVQEEKSDTDLIKVVIEQYRDLFQEMVGVDCTHNDFGVDVFNKTTLEFIGINVSDVDDEDDDDDDDDEE